MPPQVLCHYRTDSIQYRLWMHKRQHKCLWWKSAQAARGGKATKTLFFISVLRTQMWQSFGACLNANLKRRCQVLWSRKLLFLAVCCPCHVPCVCSFGLFNGTLEIHSRRVQWKCTTKSCEMHYSK